MNTGLQKKELENTKSPAQYSLIILVLRIFHMNFLDDL